MAAKLTPNDRRKIIAALKAGEKPTHLAVEFGVDVSTIRFIGRWAKVPKELRGRGVPSLEFCTGEKATPEERAEVAKRKAEVNRLRKKGIIPDGARAGGETYQPRVYPDPRPIEDLDKDEVIDSEDCDDEGIEGMTQRGYGWREVHRRKWRKRKNREQ